MKLIAQTQAMANADIIRGRRNSMSYLAPIRDVENKEDLNDITIGKGTEHNIRNSAENNTGSSLASSTIDRDNLGS